MKEKLSQTPQENKGSYKDTMRDSMTPNSITRRNESVPRNVQTPWTESQRTGKSK